MFYQILSFLLDVATGLLAGASLLRLYMQYHRVPFNNPMGRFVFALTDWLVMPLRKVIPAFRRWDLASLLGAWLLMCVKYLLLMLLLGGVRLLILPVLGLFGLVQLVVSAMTALLVIYAVMSWFPQASPMLKGLIERLVDPVVRPLRRVIPLVGGVDLSPLAAIVLLQVLGMVLGNLLASVYGLGR